MKKITIIMMGLSVISKILGFAREMVLSNIYGASSVSDAFIFSNNLASTIFSIIIAAFVTGLIPMYTKIAKKESEDNAILFMNNVQNTMVLIGLIVSILFFIFTEVSLKLLMPNASIELLNYLIPFTKISVFSIILTCFIQVLTGYLHIKSSFLVPILIAFPTNIILILAIYFSKTYGVLLLPISILIAYMLQTLIIYFHARRQGFKFKSYINFKDENLIMMLKLAVPLILGSATSTIGGLVNQSIASGTEGGISYINYATRIGNILEGIFGVAIVSVMYPSLSKLVAELDLEKARDSFEQSLTALILFIMPSALGMLFLAKPIVEFIYLRGEFTSNEVNILLPVFITYSIGLVSYSTYGLVTKVFYSFQDTKTPMLVAIFNISVQIILGITLSNSYGLAGVTLAMAISSTLGVLLLLIFSERLFNHKLSVDIVMNFAKIFISSLIMGIASLITFRIISVNLSQTIALITSISLGVLVYIFLILLFKIRVVRDFIYSIKKPTRI